MGRLLRRHFQVQQLGSKHMRNLLWNAFWHPLLILRVEIFTFLPKMMTEAQSKTNEGKTPTSWSWPFVGVLKCKSFAQFFLGGGHLSSLVFGLRINLPVNRKVRPPCRDTCEHSWNLSLVLVSISSLRDKGKMHPVLPKVLWHYSLSILTCYGEKRVTIGYLGAFWEQQRHKRYIKRTQKWWEKLQFWRN